MAMFVFCVMYVVLCCVVYCFLCVRIMCVLYVVCFESQQACQVPGADNVIIWGGGTAPARRGILSGV